MEGAGMVPMAKFCWIFWQVLVGLLLANAASGAEDELDAYPQDISFRHVFFEQQQGNYREAYIAADYYEQRGLGSDSTRLTQAAASLELGYLDHGRALVAELEQANLLPRHQARLRLYLARDAYQRRDWTMLQHQLLMLSEHELDLSDDQNMQHFLQAELASQQGAFDRVDQNLAAMDKQFRLRPHALFNAAVALSRDDARLAIPRLETLLLIQPTDLAGFTLRDRARVALAEIHLKQGEWRSAREALVGVSAKHRYGPYALAQLARLDMEAEHYEGAAAIWQYLLKEHTWHRASTHAVSGLGYAVQQTRGDDIAFQVYTRGLQDMDLHQQRLAATGLRVRAELQNPDLFHETSEPLLLLLSDSLGSDDWLDWLASTEIRTLVSRWRALSIAYEKLLTDGENLTALQQVDAEWQRRITIANEAVENDDLATRLTAVRDDIVQARDRLLTTEFSFGDDLDEFATTGQLGLIGEITRLKQRLRALPRADDPDGQRENIEQRLDRLEGLLRFAVFFDLPKKKQQRISEYEQQLSTVVRSGERLSRISGAAIRHPESVGVRIEALADKRRSLQQETMLALGVAREQVLASLDQLIQHDQERLQNQMAGLQYDVTRLADRRLASEVSP